MIIISFCRCVRKKKFPKRLLASCPSVRPSFRMEQLGFHWADFGEILYIYIFSKIYREHPKFHSNMTRIGGTLREDVFTFMTASCWILLRMRNVSDKSCRGNQNNFMLINIFFRKACRLWDKVVKCDEAREVTGDNMAHALCMLGKRGYTRARTRPRTRAHTQICNTHCFSTATTVSWTRLSATLYIHRLSCCTCNTS